jgi:hypothetical protein
VFSELDVVLDFLVRRDAAHEQEIHQLVVEHLIDGRAVRAARHAGGVHRQRQYSRR